MNKHRSYYPLDEAPAEDGDASFLGVNCLDDPATLDPGELAYAENIRCDSKRAATREGVRLMTWAGHWQVGDDAGMVRPFASLATPAQTAGVYSDPISGFQWVMVVTDSRIWRCRAGNRAVPVSVQAGESLSGATDVVQTYNGLVLLRGRERRPLSMSSVHDGWSVPPSPSVVGKETMPPLLHATYFANRLFGVDGRHGAKYVDSIWVSDIGGAASVLQGDDIYQSFKINQGSADRLVAVAKFNDTTLVAAKESSIYVVSGISGTNAELAERAQLDEVTRQYGCKAPRSFVQVGKDVWFLGHKRGVCSIAQTEQNKLQAVDVPVSRLVQPIVDRINWQAAAGAVATAWGNRVYFAIPIDGSTYNNAILVYSSLTQRWAGIDTGAAIDVLRFVQFAYDGAVRAGFVTRRGHLCLLEDGYLDHTADDAGNVTLHPITYRILTRGYGGKTGGLKRATQFTPVVYGQHMSYGVNAIAPGKRKVLELANRNPDRSVYTRPFNRPAWVTTNVNADFSEPNREDYPVITPIATQPLTGGPVLGVLQHDPRTWSFRKRVTSLQFEIVNTRGRFELASLTAAAQRDGTRSGSMT